MLKLSEIKVDTQWMDIDSVKCFCDSGFRLDKTEQNNKTSIHKVFA